MSHQYLPSTYFDWPKRPHGLYLHDGVYNEYVEYDYYAGDEIHENNVAFRGPAYISFDDTHTRWLNKTDIHMYDTSSVKIFDSGTLSMHTSASPFSRGFTVDSLGRVGIGMIHEEPHENPMETPSFDLDVRGTVGIEDYMYHNDDTDTYMLFGSDSTNHFVNTTGNPDRFTTTDFDEINFRVGGVDMLQMLEDDTQDHITFNKSQHDVDTVIRTSTNTHAFVVSGDGSEVVINGSGNSDTDLRVESDKSDKMLFVDSSNDAVYLHGPDDDSDILVVYGNGNDGLSGHNLFKVNPAEITFNASSNDVDFRIASDNTDSSQSTADAGTDGNSVTHLTHDPEYAFFLNSNNGRVGLGTNAPDTTLHIAGSAHIEGDLWVKGHVNQIDTFVHMTSAVDITNRGTGPALTVNQTGIHPVVTFRDDGRDIFYIEDGGNVGFQTSDPHTSVYINDDDGIRIPIGDSASRPLSGAFGITGDPASADFSAMYGTIRYNVEYQTFEGFGPGDAWGSLGGVIDIDRDTFWTALNDISGSDYPGDPDTLRAYVGNDGDPTKTTGLLMMTISANKTIIHNPDVGIGTTDPLGELHVKGGRENDQPVKLILEGPEQAFDQPFPQPMGMIGFTSAEGAIDPHGVVDVASIRADATKDFNAGSYGSELSFHTTNNSASSSSGRMWIKENGRVGIGTNSPERELTLRGIFRWGEASHYTYSGQDTGGVYIEQVDNNTNRAKIRLQTRPNSSGTYSVFRIDADDRFFRFDNGDVGVGKTPAHKLDVLTNSDHYAGYFRNDHATGGGGILSWMPNAAPTRFVAYLEGTDTHKGLYVKGDGKTGIGTTAPLATLHIKPRLATSNSSTTSSPLYLDTPANTVSMFVGTNTDTAGFGANSYSGNIRFNGSNQAWGDFGFYPTGGGDGEYGEFRFSKAGSTVNTSPNAKVGVGSLFVDSKMGIATSAPRARLEIQENQNTSLVNYTSSLADAGVLISTNYTAGAYTPGLFWQTDNSHSGEPKAGIFTQLNSNGSRLILGTSDNYSAGITKYMCLDENGRIGVNLSSPATNPSAAIDVRGYDGETTMIRIGNSQDGGQGTGAIELTQDGSAGGGMYYNGDLTPNFASAETADFIGLYRMAGGSRHTVMKYKYNSSDIEFAGGTLTIPQRIAHVGDTDTYHEFHQADHWRVTTGGVQRLQVTNGETTVSNTLSIGDIKLKESADRSDLLEITSTTGTWAGIQIRNSSNEGRWSFMTDGEYAGIYNDEDNQWHIHMQEGGYTKLYYASGERLTTTSGGVDFHDKDLQSVKDIYIGNQIVHDGDSNTYMQFHNNDQWRVVTGAVERLEVTSSYVTSQLPHIINTAVDQHLVLAGSTNPYIRFQEGGVNKAYIQWNGGSGELMFYNQESSEHLKIGSGANGLIFNSSGSNATVWHSNNDGSGTGLDADKLDGIQGSSYLRSDAVDTASQRIQFSGCATNNQDTIANSAGSLGSIEIFNTGSGNDAFMAFHAGGDYAGYFGLDADTNDLAWGGWSVGAVKHRIWHAGNDGDGSGLHADLLDGKHASTGSNVNTIVVRDGNGDTNHRYVFSQYLNMSHSTATRSSDNTFYSSTDSYLRKNNATGMRASLNVPTRTGGNASGTWGININGSSASCTGVSSKVTVNQSNTGGGNYELMWQASGNTAYSSDWFYINRDAKTLYCAGDIVAFASDERLKENITLIESPLEKLSKISGYNFNFNEKGADVTGQPQHRKQMGVIAQEIEQVCPELIEPAPGDNDYKTVKYDKLVPLLIESIKAQQEQIDTLKQEVEQLKQQ